MNSGVNMEDNISQTKFVNVLTKLTQENLIEWSLCTNNSTSIDARSRNLEVEDFYETKFEDKIIILFDKSSDGKSLGFGFGKYRNDFLYSSGFELVILNSKTKREEINIKGKSLKSLYSIVSSKVGTSDSIIENMLESANKLLIKNNKKW